MTTANENSINIDELISIVAKKHNLLLTKDDPVLVTVTLSQEVIKKYLLETEKSFEKLKSELELLYYRNHEESKELAKKIINTSLKAASDSINNSVSIAAKKVVSDIEAIQKNIVLENEKNQKGNNKTKLVSIICATVCFLATLATIAIILVK